jgi:phosphatidylinositol dimannoside acyltransferase
MKGRAASASDGRPVPRHRLRHRVTEELTAFAAIGGMKLLLHLPERVVWPLAGLAGRIEYRASTGRRDHARRNLRRVVRWMAANGLGDERYRRAVSDPASLEQLVKDAFRHHAYYSVELARAPSYDARWISERLIVETPENVAELLTKRRAMILIGMHFGAIEMPGTLAVQGVGPLVTPMEFVANPRIQRYIYSTRAAVGTTIVSLKDAPTALIAALRRDEPVGLVADRDITGGGVEVELFGATTRIPAGPALLAGESGAPVCMGAVRRTAPGRYRGKLLPLPAPEGASRRERSRSMLRAEARLFEQLISDAPEQWLALFHPIWPDLEPPGVRPNGDDA